MKTIEQIAAEILVECGYADGYSGEARGVLIKGDWIDVDPFTDTIEGRRQADAIEDLLYDKHGDLVGRLFADGEIYKTADKTHSEWRKFNIKWCLEQLRDEE